MKTIVSSEKKTHRSSRLLVLLIPLALFFGACKVDTEFDASNPDSATLKIEFDTEIPGSTVKCSDLQSMVTSQKRTIGDGYIEEIPDSTGVGCRITYSNLSNMGKALVMRDYGNEFTLRIPKVYWDTFVRHLKKEGIQEDRFATFSFSVTFKLPDTVISASPGGQIKGKEVTWTGFNNVINGIEAKTYGQRSYYAPSRSTTSYERKYSQTVTPTPSAFADSDTDDGDGIPAWVWAILIIGAIAIVGLTIFLVIRKKNDNGGYSGIYPGGGVPGGFPPGTQLPPGQGFGNPQGPPPAQPYGQTGQQREHGSGGQPSPSGQPYGLPTGDDRPGYGQAGQSHPQSGQAPGYPGQFHQDGEHPGGYPRNPGEYPRFPSQ